MDTIQLYVSDPSTHLDELLESDPRLRSEHTRKGYKESIKAFDKWREGRPLTKSLLLSWMAEQQAEGKATRTINVRLSAIRWYARKLADLAADYSGDDKLTDDFARRAARILTVQVLRQNPSLKGRFISLGELEALLDACRDGSIAGKRDAAIFALLWASGMRRTELCQIEMSDLTKSDDGYTITIKHGKGDKPRFAYAHGGAAQYLNDWLEVRGEGEGLLFHALDHRMNCPGRQASLSGSALHYMLKRRAEEAGITDTSLHDFRRTNISLLWDAGVDGSTIQRLAGHSSQNTTASYDRRPQETQMQASRVIHVPYRR